MNRRKNYVQPRMLQVPLDGNCCYLKNSEDDRFIPVDPGGEYGGEFDVKEHDPYHYSIWDEEW